LWENLFDSSRVHLSQAMVFMGYSAGIFIVYSDWRTIPFSQTIPMSGKGHHQALVGLAKS
jgi:hypothetical protein